jgi:hypothetical protein
MALRRDVYLAVGGLQHQYGRFAEMILAAALRDAGLELGYARDSVVHHHYRETLHEMIEGTEEYVRDECGYRAANPGPDRIGHTYLPDLANPYSPGAAALDREMAAMLLSSPFGSTSARREALRALGRVLARSLGQRGPVLAEWIALTTCRLRCWWHRNNAAKLDGPYRELVRRASRLGHVRSFATQSVDEAPLPAPSESIAMDSLPAWAMHGFHGVERMNGATFRWTSAVAAVRFRLSRNDYTLRLITNGLRREGVNLRVALNNTRLDLVELSTGDYEIAVKRSLCYPTEQTLILVCDALRPWLHGVPDYRELGLPLFAIEAVPMGGSKTIERKRAA